MNRNTTVTLSLALLACAVLIGLACAGAPAVASVSLAATPVTIDVDLPSASTGTPGGTLALRIFAPGSAGDGRYPEGAPVVVYVPGGTDAGTLRPALQDADDVIRLVFLFPGGSDPRVGRSSDGAYDYRGSDSIAALRDVVRYAAGELTDAAGNTIDDVLPVPVLHDNIGLLGGSNGGNIIVAVAGEHGGELAGHLRYIVQWESPVSSQIATVDLGRVNLDCTPGQRQSLLAVNPRYLSYGPLTLEVDYSQLVYDAGDSLHPIFFDGTGDGHYTTVLDPHTGCQTPDLNLNGSLELNEDFPLSAFSDGVKHYYSRPVTQALTALFDPPSQQAPASFSKFPRVPRSSLQFPRVPRSSLQFPRPRGTRRNSEELGGTPWPPDIATPPEANTFWDLREAVRQYPDALTNIPGLEGMVLTSLVDHVQTAPDHPHIHQAFDGWDGNSAWVKINPARDYVLEVDPSLSSRTDLPDNAANTAPADWSDAASYAFPDGLEETYFAAAVHEMADRAHTVALSTATPSATPSASSTPTPTSTPTVTATPTSTLTITAPAKSGTVSLNELHGWTPEMDNHLKIFDVAVDERRNRTYVMGIMTAGIAVIDGETDTLIGSVDSGRSEASPGRTYLAVHPTTGVLYIANWHAQTLRMVDPDTGAITGPVALPGDPFDVVVDSAQNRVYVSMRAFGKVGVYDATSLAEVAVIDLGANRIGGLALDSAANRLYVVDSDAPDAANHSRLYVIDTDTLTPSAPIPFDNPFGPPANFADVDPATGRLFVTTSDHLFILASDGSTERLAGLPADSKAPIYWNDTGKVYVVSRDGISPIESSVSVIDAATGHLDQTVALGTGGAQHAALNTSTGKLYTAGMEYTDVVVFDTATNSVAGSVDIGNSVEDIVTAPADGTAYFANRLGGSTVIAYRPDTGEWGEFEAGGWPTDLDVDSALNRLYVLSHYQGTVSAFDLSSDTLNPTLLAAVPLGLTDHDDALSSMALDATHHRLITTHPEHGSIVVVDGDGLSVAATISDVPSFTFNSGNTAGPGHLQPAVDEGLNKLYVLVSRAKRVDVFDGDAGYAYEHTIDLSSYNWDWQADFDDNYIWVDSTRHRLYVGPLIIDTTTDAYAGLLPLDAGQVVVGVDDAANLLYTIGVEPTTDAETSELRRLRTGSASKAARSRPSDPRPGVSGRARPPIPDTQSPISNTQSLISDLQSPQTAHLYTIDRNTYAVETQTDLREVTYYVPPYVALDADRGRLYAGYMQRAEVDIYTLSGGAPSPPASQCVGDVNGNGVGDIADIMATASDLPCHVYLPLVAAQWHQPWPTPTPTSSPAPTVTPSPTQEVDVPEVSIGDANPADPTVKPLLGVISGPDHNAGFTTPNLTTQYQDVGVFSVRNNDYYDDRLDMEGIFNCGGPTYPSWEGCDPNDDTYYNWGPSDAQFASYLNGGFDPFLRLGGEWENRDHPHDFKGPQNATQEANWIIAAQKVVDRYLYWNGGEKTFTYLDIWTEFPGDHFWDRSNVEFIAFWVRAYASLKGAYPQLKVGGPGFGAGETMKVIEGNAQLSLALLGELYNQGLPLDWFGWHLFNNDPTTWAQAAVAYRQLLDGAGPYADAPWAGTGFFADTEVIVDAYGLSSRDADGSPLPPDERNQLHNGPRGASLLTASWIAMQYTDVERAYYYRGTDFGSSSPGDGSGGPGLFYSDAAGTYKPSAHAFRLWSQIYQRYPHLLHVALPSAEQQAPLWVLAARNDQGDIALLAANPSADAVTWSPRFADGTTLTDYAQVELYQVDGTNDGRTSTPFTGSAVTTAGYTVQLLVLELAPAPTLTPSPSATPTAIATPTATPASTPESWVYEETVFYNDEDLSRPELCFVGDRAYLALRKVVTPGGGGPKERLIVLKVFDVDGTGDWTDRTADLFADDPHVLYGPGDPNPAGDFTDHQLICSDDAFFVVFEAHYKQAGQDLKRTVVRRYLPDWSFDRQAFLFDGAVGLTEYKTDDPGAALLNGTLFTWVVKLSQSPLRATGFALYGVDPLSLEVTVDDPSTGSGQAGSDGPVILANPEHAPFAGVMDFIDGEYHLLSSPHAAGEPLFIQDGLVDYRYDLDWTLLGYEVAEHPFGADQPTYATGRIRYAGNEAWGFTLQPEGRSQDGGVIGQAWVRLAEAGGGVTYFLVSDNDATPEDNDTRHTELAIHNGKAYVAYFHIVEGTDHATTIKRYRIPTTDEALNRPEDPQIGLNFIRFFWSPPGEPDTTTPYVQPEWIFNDFAELGIHAFRQFIKADLLWNIVEPQDNQWNFEAADAVITNPDFEPIVTLFALQYASATPPWATDPTEFQKTLGPEARDYLETIIDRYGPYVKYWEIGNEMDHWRAADPDAVNPNPPNLPPSYPLDGFSPQEQGVFLAQVAAFIRERDPDAVIIMPGMGGLDDYALNTWFAGVIEGGGTDWFDVVNYHYYPDWQAYGRRRQDLQTFLADHGIAGKPVWLTETGSTASPTLTIRTNYPNSPESQAADVFRRLVQAYGYGDSLAMWHTYIGSPDTPSNMWRLYGIRTDTAEAQPSYYAFKLLTTELIPFASVEILSNVPAGENSFKITTEAGDVKYVAWGSGNFAVPAGVTQMASVIPNTDGGFTWQAVGAGDVVTLAPEPVLLK